MQGGLGCFAVFAQCAKCQVLGLVLCCALTCSAVCRMLGGVRPPGGGVEEEGWRVVSRVVLILMLLVLVLGSADRC